MKVKLFDIAYARSGDKGSNANVAIIAYSYEAFLFLKETLTEKMVYNYFKEYEIEKVIRYELENLWALNFVLKGILGKGGSSSLKLDSQGKALGQAILEMDVTIDDPSLIRKNI